MFIEKFDRDIFVFAAPRERAAQGERAQAVRARAAGATFAAAAGRARVVQEQRAGARRFLPAAAQLGGHQQQLEMARPQLEDDVAVVAAAESASARPPPPCGGGGAVGLQPQSHHLPRPPGAPLVQLRALLALEHLETQLGQHLALRIHQVQLPLQTALPWLALTGIFSPSIQCVDEKLKAKSAIQNVNIVNYI